MLISRSKIGVWTKLKLQCDLDAYQLLKNALKRTAHAKVYASDFVLLKSCQKCQVHSSQATVTSSLERFIYYFFLTL